MIDVDFRLAVSDRHRRFDLDIAFEADAPVTALYGPSGAGKSLTLQAIAGLLKPSQGHVRIAGRTLFDSAQRVDVEVPKRRLGYLFQHYALFPHLSVRDNVAFGLSSWRCPVRHLPRQTLDRIDALLETFGLSAMAESRPVNLSGGQQQRVALARALACEPSALLLDEPFAALNPMLRHALRDELAQVQARWNIPIVMITHDVEDVVALANVAFLFDGGRIVRRVDLDRAECVDLQRERIEPGLPKRPARANELLLRRMLDAPAQR